MPRKKKQTQEERDAAWIARLDPPVSSPGKWYPASAFKRPRKSFGCFKCSCGSWWVSAHAFVNHADGWQECKNCGEECDPFAMWLNDDNDRYDRHRSSSEPQNGKPHEQSLCGMCIARGQPCWLLNVTAPEVPRPRSTATSPRPPTQYAIVAPAPQPQPAQNVWEQRAQQQREAERQRLAEVERQRLVEAERQRLAEAERKRLVEAAEAERGTPETRRWGHGERSENTSWWSRRLFLLILVVSILTLVSTPVLYRSVLKIFVSIKPPLPPPPPPPPSISGSITQVVATLAHGLLYVAFGIPFFLNLVRN